MHAGRDAALEATRGNGQRIGALHLLACAHAAVADDALRGIVGEVEAIDNIALILKTVDSKLVIPIKNIVESEIKIQN